MALNRRSVVSSEEIKFAIFLAILTMAIFIPYHYYRWKYDRPLTSVFLEWLKNKYKGGD
jgi:hypothetical protein